MGEHVLKNKSILVVEDDVDLLDCYRQMLSSCQVNVYGVGGYCDAVTLVEGGLQPDFFLVDMLMPGKNGFDLILKLKPICKTAIFIATSGDWSAEIKEKACVGS